MTAATPYSTLRGDWAGTKVLVVEDEALNALYLAALLEAWGCIVQQAASLEEAMKAAAAQRPDLVLMDITLGSRQDGIPAAKALRDLYGVPVIFASAHVDARTKEKAQEVRPAGYLVKPFTAAELAAVMTEAMRAQALQQVHAQAA